MKYRQFPAAALLLAGAAHAQAPAPPAVRADAPAPLAAQETATDKDGRIRVQIWPRQQTALSAELSAKVASLPFKEGDAFRAGQALVGFDCSVFRAQLAKASAQAEAAEQTLAVNRRLGDLNSISTLEVEQAAAKVKETAAEVAAMRVTVGKCSLAAPFGGRVAKVHVEPHQYVAQGRPLLDIVDVQRPEAKLIVPSRWLEWLAPGTRFTVRVDDLNRDYPAQVVRLGARVDAVTQSVSVVGEIQGASPNLLPGMSGWATFRPPAK